MDFIAIDFEIANNNMSSACSLGMAFVNKNQIVDEKYYLIHPPTMEFDPKMIKVHGIRPIDVINAKNFNVVWEEIKHYFQDSMIIAHNAQFDMSVLYSCLSEYSLEMPNFNYICSIPISTRACSGKGIGNSLAERLAYFNIQLEDHHNALADARACAELVLTCMNLKKRKSIQSYCSTYSSIPVKSFSELKPQTAFKKRRNFDNRIVISEIATTVETFNENHVLFEKNIVFTGELETIDRRDAMQKVVDLGGIVKSGVSGKTDYLVVGIQDKSLVGDDGLSTKEVKAYELI